MASFIITAIFYLDCNLKGLYEGTGSSKDWKVVGKLCFFISTEKKNYAWTYAYKEMCLKKYGANFVTISSLKEQMVIESEIHRVWGKIKEEKPEYRETYDKKFKTVFFGAQRTDPFMFDKWKWVDGSEVKWTNWENDNEKNEKNMGMCAALALQDDDSYKWKTVSCNNTNIQAMYMCAINASFGKILKS